MQGSALLFDEGRFGPVYRSHDPETNEPVLVRTFALPLTADARHRLVDALSLLCETPLDHPGIARPLIAGIDEGRPFLVHTLLPGTSLQRFLEEKGPQPFPEVVLRVTQLAAAIDFAAAAGVHHGDLGVRDVIVAPEATGISGFGVIQALESAGVATGVATPTHAGDIEALARLAFELLRGGAPESASDVQTVSAEGADTVRLRQALVAALGKERALRPSSALELAATLQQAVAQPASGSETLASGPETSAPVRLSDVRLTRSGDRSTTPTGDLPLREAPASRFADIEPSLPLSAPPPPVHAPAAAPPPAGARSLAREPASPAPARVAPRDAAAVAPAYAASHEPAPAPAARAAASVPVVHPPDLTHDHLRAPEPPTPMLRDPAASMFSSVTAAPPVRREHSSGWLLIAGALAIGILSGFVGGFVVGQRGGQLPVPRFAADVLRPADEESPAPAPEPTTGLNGGSSGTVARPGSASPDTGARGSEPIVEQPNITSRDLDPGTAASQPAASAPAADASSPTVGGNAASAAAVPPVASGIAQPGARAAASGTPGSQPGAPASGAPSTAAPSGAIVQGAAPRTGAPATAASRPAVPADTPGGLQVLSRPEGAQVFVDGALVGQTPLLIPSVRAGTHDVRIELTGHKRWATAVRVDPGERARVAASLEQ